MRYYLSLGTNLGNKEENLREAVKRIEEQIGNVVSLSAFHVTSPWGFQSENSFLNVACCVETALEPMQMLAATQHIERELGRTRKSENGVYHDRLIDIDILLCFDAEGNAVEVDKSELTIPHRLMTQRDFVMIPLKEILS